MRRLGRDPSGFTVIELMVVIAIIAVLAGIVVPTFLTTSRKGKGSAEVSGMLAELATKEDAYKNENSTYVVAAQCPTAAPSSDYNFLTTCETSSSAWETLRIQPTESSLRCAYEIQIGAAGVDPVSPDPTNCPLPTNPAESWYVIIATCDLDGQSSGGNSQYWLSSLDHKICKLNEGQ